jgi:hypothetical protein
MANICRRSEDGRETESNILFPRLPLWKALKFDLSPVLTGHRSSQVAFSSTIL